MVKISPLLGMPPLRRPGYPLIEDPLHPLWVLQERGWIDYSPTAARALAELVNVGLATIAIRRQRAARRQATLAKKGRT